MESNQLHLEEMAFDCRPADLDLRQLQRAFSSLFDRAADAVQRLGLDVDDIVFDRILVCQTAGGQLEVSADWLADKGRLLAHLDTCINRASGDQRGAAANDPPSPRIIALKVVVRSEPLPVREFPSHE